VRFFALEKLGILRIYILSFFGFQVRTYPFKYLGIPMHYKTINNIDWKELEQRIEKKNSVVGKQTIIGWRKTSFNQFSLD
jgi:hypothetical protein